jgi:ribosomal protein S18 acetylase RimI-like enzyme
MEVNNNNTLHNSPPTERLEVGILLSLKADFPSILEIQKNAFYSEAVLYNNFSIQPLTQTLEEMVEECKDKVVLKAVVDGKIVGSIRANKDEDYCWVNKLVVLPAFQRRGIGEKLLLEIENHFPNADKFILATGAKSESNIRLYEKVGYKTIRKETFHDGVEAVVLEKETNP